MKKIINITPLSEEEKLLEAFRRFSEENEKSLYTINENRYNEMRFSAHVLLHLFTRLDPNAEVNVKPSNSGKDKWYITFKANDLTVQTYEMDDFKRIVNMADNFEVYPIKGNRLAGSFTFLGVMQKRT